MKKPLRKTWNVGNGYKRLRVGKRSMFFRKGKLIKKASFERALKKIRVAQKKTRVKKKRAARKDTKILRKALGLPPLKRRTGFNLCHVKDRAALYEQIKTDRKEMFDKIGDEEFSAVRMVIDIDPEASKRARKKDKIGRGYRSFRDLRKLKNFLGLNYSYRGDHTPVDWSKRGVCKFEKTGKLTVVKLRGERKIGERVLRRYKFGDY